MAARRWGKGFASGERGQHGNHYIDGQLGGHLAAVVAADSISHNRQHRGPAVTFEAEARRGSSYPRCSFRSRPGGCRRRCVGGEPRCGSSLWGSLCRRRITVARRLDPDLSRLRFGGLQETIAESAEVHKVAVFQGTPGLRHRLVVHPGPGGGVPDRAAGSAR